jgi:hypothetical protein
MSWHWSAWISILLLLLWTHLGVANATQGPDGPGIIASIAFGLVVPALFAVGVWICRQRPDASLVQLGCLAIAFALPYVAWCLGTILSGESAPNLVGCYCFVWYLQLLLALSPLLRAIILDRPDECPQNNEVAPKDR